MDKEKKWFWDKAPLFINVGFVFSVNSRLTLRISTKNQLFRFKMDQVKLERDKIKSLMTTKKRNVRPISYGKSIIMPRLVFLSSALNIRWLFPIKFFQHKFSDFWLWKGFGIWIRKIGSMLRSSTLYTKNLRTPMKAIQLKTLLLGKFWRVDNRLHDFMCFYRIQKEKWITSIT